MKRFSLITLLFLTLTHTASAFVVDEFEFTIIDAEKKSVSVKRNKAHDYSRIDSLTIPKTVIYNAQTYNVTEIGFEGFRDLRADRGFPLKKIILPEGLKVIGGKAFVGLYDIKDTTIIPSTVDTIGDYAFADWVTPIQFLSEVPAALGGTQVFRDNLKQNSSIIIPCGTYNAYSTVTEWKNCITRIVDPCYLTFEVESLKYKTEDGVNATLLGYAGKAPATISIPNIVSYNEKNYVVRKIGSKAFQDSITIGTLIIGDSIIEIGASAFYNCKGLQSITFGSNLRTIRDRAFVGCTALQETVIIPATVSLIEEYAFAEWECPISILSETPATLGREVFRDQNGKHSSISIPCGTYDIYYAAAGWNTYVSRIIDPCRLSFEVDDLKYSTKDGSNVTVLGFATGKENTEELVIPATVTYAEKNYMVSKLSRAVFNGKKTLKTVDIQANISEITAYAFNACSGLTSITWGNSITKIDSLAFYGCTNLASYSLPSNLKVIEYKAFVDCYGYSDTLSIPASVHFLGEHAFTRCYNTSFRFEGYEAPEFRITVIDGNNTITQFTDITPLNLYIPCGSRNAYLTATENKISAWIEECFTFNDGILCYSVYPDNDTLVKTIGFADGKETANLVIPNKVNYADHNYIVQSIDKSAFINCLTIETVVLGDSIIEIGASAFYNCKGLQSITFGSNLRTIRDRAFVGCTALQETVIIPATVSLIEEYAFAEWECPISILSETPATLGREVFRDNNKKASPIILPCGTLETYKTATNWSSFSSRFVSACKPLKLTKGEALTQDTIVSSIAFSRTFPMNLWQELYLPFEMDSMLLFDDGYWNAFYPFNSDSAQNGGYFYLYGLKEINMATGIITFQEEHKLKAHTPYLILFVDKHMDYFKDREFVFKSKNGEYTLTDNYTAPKLTSSYQLFGNETLWNHGVPNGFTLSPTYSYENGIYNYDFHFNYAETAELPPFSWVVTPTMAIQSMPSLAPRFLSGRWGNQPSSGGGDTPTSMQTVSDWVVTYTQTGSQLTLYTQGQPCKVYAIDGTLLLSTNGSQEEVSIELDKGMYIIYSNGHSQKVLF